MGRIFDQVEEEKDLRAKGVYQRLKKQGDEQRYYRAVEQADRGSLKEAEKGLRDALVGLSRTRVDVEMRLKREDTELIGVLEQAITELEVAIDPILRKLRKAL